MALQDPLVNKIYEVYETSLFPPDHDRDFVPAHCLEELITEDAVIAELGVDMRDEEAAKKAKELASWISKFCKNVFATTILCGVLPPSLFPVMQEFMINHFDDAHLPVRYEEKGEANTWPLFFQTEYWDRRLRREFKEKQWQVQVPIFTDAEIKVNLDMDHILPIISVDEDTREGTFGKVYQVTIHRNHMESPMLKVRCAHENDLTAVARLASVSDP